MPIQLDTTSEQNILNMLMDQSVINSEQMAKIKVMSKEIGKSKLETAFELNFTDEKKIEILNKEVEKFCYENNFSNKDLTINKIESNFKIILNMSSDFASKQKTKHYLLQLEEIIRINVDFRLEVFISMRHDTNKLRMGKSFMSD